MKKIIFAVLLVISSMAQADTYFTAGVGASSETNRVLAIGAGYKVNDTVSVEGRYIDFGKKDGSNKNVILDQTYNPATGTCATPVCNNQHGIESSELKGMEFSTLLSQDIGFLRIGGIIGQMKYTTAYSPALATVAVSETKTIIRPLIGVGFAFGKVVVETTVYFNTLKTYQGGQTMANATASYRF